MRKYILSLFLFFKCFNSFTQSPDLLTIDNWTNFNRPRGAGDNYSSIWVSRKYVTYEGDTLVRKFGISGEFHQVLTETSYLHDKKNGLNITYFPNGVVKDISYYLNDRIWEVISRADSTGKLLFPGNLHNGNGTRYFSADFDYEPNCYETYKNGLPEGAFYWQRDDRTFVKGNLTYKKSEVNFIPAKKVVFIYNFSGERAVLVFDTTAFRSIFLEDHTKQYRILSVTDDSLEEPVKIYKFINVGFGDDPATIPKGTWQVIDTINGHIKMEVSYDDHGNAFNVRTFDENGEILAERKFPSYNKREW